MAFPPPPSAPLDLDITVISAKHLKNVNWRSGTLKPYATVFLEPDRRLSTRPDEHGSTSPVWNERLSLPLTSPLHDSFLTVEIFHSRPDETSKPSVASIRLPLLALVDASADRNHKLDLLRPSGRPQGKVMLRLALRERQIYSAAAAAPPYQLPQPYPYAHRYDQFPAYPYYPQYAVPPPPPAWSHFSRPPSHGPPVGPSAPPSAPVDFSYPTATSDPKLVPPPPRWTTDNGQPPASPNLTRVNSYGAMLGGPTAPDEQRPQRSHEPAGLVADALGRVSLGEGSRHEADYAWRAPESHNHSCSDYRRYY